MADKNVTIKRYNSNNQWDTIYPKTTASNVSFSSSTNYSSGTIGYEVKLKANASDVQSTYMAISDYTDNTNHKILLNKLPDVILNQMIFGGTIMEGILSSTKYIVLDFSDTGWDILNQRASNQGDSYTSAITATRISTDKKLKIYEDGDESNNPTYIRTITEGMFFLVTTSNSYEQLSTKLGLDSTTQLLEVGDWVISKGSGWGKVDNTDAVRTVNGKIGSVETYVGDYASSYTFQSATSFHIGDIIHYTDSSNPQKTGYYLCVKNHTIAQNASIVLATTGTGAVTYFSPLTSLPGNLESIASQTSGTGFLKLADGVASIDTTEYATASSVSTLSGTVSNQGSILSTLGQNYSNHAAAKGIHLTAAELHGLGSLAPTTGDYLFEGDLYFVE